MDPAKEEIVGSSDHDHDHDGPGPHGAPLTETQLRVKALESLLVDKGLVDPAALDALIDTYETQVGPHNGARVVARAWVNPAFKQRLLENASAAIAELGFAGRQGEDMVVIENTSKVHNLVVCTLCSCYPWPVLGLPPVWYKSAAYRSRVVADPRGVLRDFGVELPAETENPRVGLHGRAALPRRADAPGRHGGPQRTAARRPGDARLDDRHRPAAGAADVNGVHDM